MIVRSGDRVTTLMSPQFPNTRLTVDLDAVVANWRILGGLAAPARIAAVVKADGYGLGAIAVARALAGAGCTRFCVAHAEEGMALRAVLPDAAILVLHGLSAGTADEYRRHSLLPALATLEQVAEWRLGGGGAAVLHVDTGMNRLGLTGTEASHLADDPSLLAGIDVKLVMSHLACSEEAAHPKNREQLDLFNRLRARLPGAAASLANSGGIFLGADFTLDLVRPGIALYGIDPRPSNAANLVQVFELQAKILQVRDVDRGMTVGYGASHRIGNPGRIAIIPVGYADGYLRALSDGGFGYVGGHRVPVIGRVSMDLLTLDVSAVPPEVAHPGAWVTLMGGPADVRDVAARAGTIGYELMTGLGARYRRQYKGGAA